MVVLDQQRGGHGGVHLAHAAAAGDDIGPDAVKGHTVHRLHGGGPVDEAVDLRRHGVKKGDMHRYRPRFVVLLLL